VQIDISRHRKRSWTSGGRAGGPSPQFAFPSGVGKKGEEPPLYCLDDPKEVFFLMSGFQLAEFFKDGFRPDPLMNRLRRQSFCWGGMEKV